MPVVIAVLLHFEPVLANTSSGPLQTLLAVLSQVTTVLSVRLPCAFGIQGTWIDVKSSATAEPPWGASRQESLSKLLKPCAMFWAVLATENTEQLVAPPWAGRTVGSRPSLAMNTPMS